jgi:monoamine oxidase
MFAKLYPDHTVLAVAHHDWVKDENARGSWQAERTGLAEAVPSAFGTQGSINFAGGDYMDPWCGWIEGAILSGKRAATAFL